MQREFRVLQRLHREATHANIVEGLGQFWDMHYYVLETQFCDMGDLVGSPPLRVYFGAP